MSGSFRILLLCTFEFDLIMTGIICVGVWVQFISDCPAVHVWVIISICIGPGLITRVLFLCLVELNLISGAHDKMHVETTRYFRVTLNIACVKLIFNAMFMVY